MPTVLSKRFFKTASGEFFTPADTQQKQSAQQARSRKDCPLCGAASRGGRQLRRKIPLGIEGDIPFHLVPGEIPFVLVFWILVPSAEGIALADRRRGRCNDVAAGRGHPGHGAAKNLNLDHPFQRLLDSVPIINRSRFFATSFFAAFRPGGDLPGGHDIRRDGAFLAAIIIPAGVPFCRWIKFEKGR